MTELFLGGRQSKVANIQFTGNASESEYRLLNRLFRVHLEAIDQALGLENTWRVSLIDQPSSDLQECSACACLTTDGYQALWQIWYQKEAIKFNAAEQPKAIDHELLLAHLAYAVEKIPTNLHVVLAKTQITLAQLIKLKSGDLLPIELPEIVHAYAGKQVIAQGKIVDRGGSLVMQVIDTPEE